LILSARRAVRSQLISKRRDYLDHQCSQRSTKGRADVEAQREKVSQKARANARAGIFVSGFVVVVVGVCEKGSRT